MIIQLIKNTLPTCKFCGRIMTPTPTLRKYCTSYCRDEERKIQNQQSRYRYWNKYKHILSPSEKSSIGTSNLTGTPEEDFKAEYERVNMEKRRLGIP